MLLIMHIQSTLLHIICEMFPSIVKISFTDSTLLLELVYLVMYKKLLNEYDKWKPVDKDYMINSGENVDLLKTFSVAFQAFNEALIPVIRYLLNTKNVGKELLYLRKWGDSLQKQFHHDVHCYHIFDLKFQNGNDATHEDLDTGDVIINGTLIDWDMVYELSDSVIAMPIANTSTNNLPL